MAKALCNGSLLKCSFGLTPTPLTVLPQNRVMTSSQPAANIMDNKPLINIASFGMCRSLANPAVAGATAAALGVLTPMPCLPVIAAPWTPGSATTLLGGAPVITKESKCFCSWGGVIEATLPAQLTVDIK